MKDKSMGIVRLGRIVLAAAVGAICFSCAAGGYQDGVQRAQSEISSGSACIYTVSMADRGRTDPKTGLPYLVLEEPVTPELIQMIDGHNKTIYTQYH